VSDVVGTWTGDLGAIIQAAGSAVHVPGGLTCTGSVTLTFKPDSTFAEAGDGQCTVSGHDIPAQWNAAGSYHAEGRSLTFAGATCTGSLKACITDGTVDFKISGQTLSITQQAPSGPVTKRYTRS
jgi:hypothetical protein